MIESNKIENFFDKKINFQKLIYDDEKNQYRSVYDIFEILSEIYGENQNIISEFKGETPTLRILNTFAKMGE